jgi:hypothetical protein
MSAAELACGQSVDNRPTHSSHTQGLTSYPGPECVRGHYPALPSCVAASLVASAYEAPESF